MGLSLESTHPEVEFDADSTRDAFEKYITGLQRYITPPGGTIKSLAPQVVDPSPQIERQLEALCIKEGIPKRIFMGTERGELGSSQDARSWNGRLRRRNNRHVTPRIVAPFLDRCIGLGILPTPISYKVIWPDLETLSDQEKADVAVRRTEAMAKYIQGGIEGGLMDPADFLTRVLYFSQEEAEEIIETVAGALEEEEAEAAMIPGELPREELEIEEPAEGI